MSLLSRFSAWYERNNVSSMMGLIEVLLLTILLSITSYWLIATSMLISGSLKHILTGVYLQVREQYHTITTIINESTDRETYFGLLNPHILIACMDEIIVILTASMVLLGYMCKSTVFIKFSYIVMLVPFGFELFTKTLWDRGMISYNITRTMVTFRHMQSNFKGAKSPNFDSLMINFIQQKFECCGLIDSSEWLDPTLAWTRKVAYQSDVYNIELPISCCKIKSPYQLPLCALGHDDGDLFKKACREALKERSLFSYTDEHMVHQMFVTLIIQAAAMFVFILRRILNRIAERNLHMYTTFENEND